MSRKKLKLAISPLPFGLHENNLRTLLGGHQWGKLRKSLLESREAVCSRCGGRPNKTSDLHAHEEFELNYQAIPLVAKLTDISLVCKSCHMGEHFFRTEALFDEDKIDEEVLSFVIEHFCRVNQISLEEFDAHVEEVREKFGSIPQFGWKIDFGKYSDLLPEDRAGSRDDTRAFSFLVTSSLAELAASYGLYLAPGSKLVFDHLPPKRKRKTGFDVLKEKGRFEVQFIETDTPLSIRIRE